MITLEDLVAEHIARRNADNHALAHHAPIPLERTRTRFERFSRLVDVSVALTRCKRSKRVLMRFAMM